MRSWLSVSLVLALAACGGGSGSGSSGGGSSSSSGSETAVVAGEDEGFDDDMAADDDATIDHGSQSPHQLIGVHPPPQSWDSMSAEEREWYMIGVFLPIEAESFTQYAQSSGQGDRFSQFECENCHSDDGRENHFAMPSRSLMALPAPGSPQWEQMSHGPAYAFMHDVVVPECATMLGEQPYSPEHPDGFGCFNCHPHAR